MSAAAGKPSWADLVAIWQRQELVHPEAMEELRRCLAGECFDVRPPTPLTPPPKLPSTPSRERWDHAAILCLIPPGASVLDVGCGDGSLLELLREKLGVTGQGVERDAEMVLRCVERGVDVVQMDVDQGITFFPDASFDWVILEQTLQTLHRPRAVLKETLRVGHKGVVTFPNFGHWRLRAQLAVGGHMPYLEKLPHSWDATPDIHRLTIRDFYEWAAEEPFQIEQAIALADDAARPLVYPQDNLWAEEALFIVSAPRRGAPG